MATLDSEDRPIITCGSTGDTYLCSDLKQVRRVIAGGSVYDIKKRSDNALVDTVAMKHPDIAEEVA